MSSAWTAEQIPDQSGRTAVITGANSGLGLVAARELARHGARVVLACRDMAKGARAKAEIERDAQVSPLLAELDLADLASVRSFVDTFLAEQGEGGLDLLVNNAGVMAPPRRETSDGFELQFGTNVLGHFALTAQLIRAMQGRADARVVTVSSMPTRWGASTSTIFSRSGATFAGPPTPSPSSLI
jgi:NAD(P)-dependent dehydrogenase (short-subunit alcohol dehydrogenase family)